ncbi:uncharacterized protein [Dermacentor andersoni]|uniref:uncharacterized protein isoform X1 n=1 Tax=Dermacentor andersoni TaxID=34620 RepID=UPI003B3B2904
MHSCAVVFVFYIISGILANAVVGQNATAPPAPAAPAAPAAPVEASAATQPTAAMGMPQLGNEIPQDAPVRQKGGVAPGEPTSTNEIPTSPAADWVSKQCQFLGHECVKLEFCKPKYRLRLRGCGDGNVCCNVRKTRSCIKIGGECRKKCRGYEVPNRYVKCRNLRKKCCVAVDYQRPSTKLGT